MNLTNGVKQLLRMCGHAFVSTVHDRLNGVDQQLSQIASQLGDLRAAAGNLAEADRALLQGGIRTIEEMVDRQSSRIASELGDLRAAADSLAEADGALLQGGIRTIEELKDVRAEFRRRDAEAQQRLDEVEARWCELLGAVQQSLREQDGRLIETVEDRLARSQQTVVDAVVQLQGAVQQSLREQNGHLTETFEDRLARSHQTMVDAVAQFQGAVQRSLLDQDGHLIETVEDRLVRAHQTMVDAVARLQGDFSQFQNHLGRALENQTEVVAQVQSQLAATSALFENELVRQVCVESDDYEAVNIETGLLTFLYSHLPTRKALDIGAHVGEVSDRLLRAGYEVYAFEPAPAVYEKLEQKLKGRKDFTAFQLALGSSEGEALLHLATDLSEAKYYEDPTLLSSLVTHSMPSEIPFTHTIPVLVKTISGLHRSGLVPEDISLVKIDTEGFDLEVIRGMGDHRYPVVAAEYFDVRLPFGQSGLLYTLETLVGEMRNRGYLWHIVMHRDWHCKHTAYYCNHERAVPGTWGNAFFFRDYAMFSRAQSWCSAVLPRTYFKAVAQA